MDSNDLPNDLTMKQEPVEEHLGSSSICDVQIEEEIEFCAVQNIKQECASEGKANLELAEFGNNQEPKTSAVSCHSSLMKFNEAISSQVNKHESRDDDSKTLRTELFEHKYNTNTQKNTEQNFGFIEDTKEKENDKSFICKICGELFQKRNLFYKHSQIHKEEVYKCHICDKYLGHRKGLNTHLKRHEGITKYKCDICSKCFIFPSELKNHTQIHQGTKYECDICKYEFSRKSYVTFHMKAVHTHSKELQCKICKKHFAQRSNLRIHMVTHGASSEYQCNICNKYFGDLHELKRHFLKHSDIKSSFRCDVCDKLFVYKGSLHRHKKVHGNVRYTCDICDKTFVYKRNLSKHMKRHIREMQCICIICNNTFSSKFSLSMHMKFHSVVYTCIICGKGYVHKSGLVKHMEIHLSKNRYVCQVCNKLYCTKGSLTRHIKVHFSI